jgi:LysR family glycine cleavage system transcriptional activator
VSRQVRALEEHLGTALFERRHAGIRVTRKGQLLYDRVATKMSAIQSEAEFLRTGGRKAVIRVDAGITIAMHWLIPRLSDFTEQHPGVQVELATSDGPIDLSQSTDVFVRRDRAELRGLPSQVFLDEVSMLVGSPALRGRRSSLTPRDVARAPRIAARSRPDLWPLWCSHHGLNEAEYRPTREFDNTVLAIQAVSQGLGAMVVPALFIGSLLDQRMLVPLESGTVPTGSYSCAKPMRPGARHGSTFVDWLRKAALATSR